MGERERERERDSSKAEWLETLWKSEVGEMMQVEGGVLERRGIVVFSYETYLWDSQDLGTRSQGDLI